MGFGALNLDRLYKVDSIVKGDEEVVVQETVEQPGGSAANTIFALGKLGMPAGFIGAVGGDSEAEKVLGSLNSVGVDTSHISIKPEVRTGVVVGLIDKNGERALYIAPGANNMLSKGDLNLEGLREVDVMHMSSFVDNKQLAVQKEVVKALPEEVVLSFAPGSLYVKKGLDAISVIIRRSDILFLNEKEVRVLTGRRYQIAANYLVDMGCEIVVITLKQRGCFITDGDNSVHVEAVKTNVKDTTGAGDAFCAGFLFGIAEERELKDCGRFGNFVASECISEIGARNGLPTRAELESALE
jgi:ribokinase